MSTFWNDKKVFMTGHTGFKGSWLCLWLASLGAKVTGYALEPPTVPSLFEITSVKKIVNSIHGDVRDLFSLQTAIAASKPDIVIHMAAQPLVRKSYLEPVETYSVNVMGTVNLLEAVRTVPCVQAVLIVTSDKCYQNREWIWGYRENEPMGGHDPYSSSKGCAELVTSAYTDSFFSPERYAEHKIAVASVRAGNVIGGGDWAVDRLIPDCLKAFSRNKDVTIRNPHAIRPWQHVFEPLYGYMMLAERLFCDGPAYCGGWNFGPFQSDARPVAWIAKRLAELWGNGVAVKLDEGKHHPHEANYLKLDCTKANEKLGWLPVWSLEKALEKIVEWALLFDSKADMHKVCLKQIDEYQGDVACRL